ncbi:hypothetical protein C8R43DRAFT_1112122 [Mycena crocata]|nr:hypothetical protein C8R43DRAFT_1112122 [Mycena crocata]
MVTGIELQLRRVQCDAEAAEIPTEEESPLGSKLGWTSCTLHQYVSLWELAVNMQIYYRQAAGVAIEAIDSGQERANFCSLYAGYFKTWMRATKRVTASGRRGCGREVLIWGKYCQSTTIEYPEKHFKITASDEVLFSQKYASWSGSCTVYRCAILEVKDNYISSHRAVRTSESRRAVPTPRKMLVFTRRGVLRAVLTGAGWALPHSARRIFRAVIVESRPLLRCKKLAGRRARGK